MVCCWKCNKQSWFTNEIEMKWAGNLGNLLLIVVPAVCNQEGSPFGDSRVCSSVGLSYASFSMAVFTRQIYHYKYKRGFFFFPITSSQSLVSRTAAWWSLHLDLHLSAYTDFICKTQSTGWSSRAGRGKDDAQYPARCRPPHPTSCSGTPATTTTRPSWYCRLLNQV